LSQIPQSVIFSPQPGQMLPWLLPLHVKEVLLEGTRGGGKGLLVGQMVLTDSGWKLVEEITFHDRLTAPDGTLTNILGIYPQGIKPLFRITFDDNSEVVCDDTHLWTTREHDNGPWVIKETQELFGIISHQSDHKWFVPGFCGNKEKQIVGIKSAGYGPTICFSVDHISQQFVCQNYTVTHNTMCLLASFLRGVGKGWGSDWKGVCFKRTHPETLPLMTEAIKFYSAACPNIKVVQHPYGKFIWPSGEHLTIRHMFDESDYDDIHGSQYTWQGWEELTNWATPEAYLKCMSLLRSAHPEASKWMQVWSTTNPGQIGHQWVMDRWQLPRMRNKIIEEAEADKEVLARWSDDALVMAKPRPRASIFLDVRNNRKLLDHTPEYLADMARQASSDIQRRAWINGEWEIAAGGLFSDRYDRRYHVLDRFPIPRAWRIDRALDWGSTSPFCVLWFAESDGCDFQDANGNWRSSIAGDIYIIYEWYGTTGNKANEGLKLTAGEVSKGIIEREIEWNIYERTYPGPADNQIHMELQAGQNLASDFAADVRLDDGREFPGVQWEKSDKGDGSRKTGCDMIRERLRRAVPDPKSPTLREQPSLFFISDLKWTLKHFPVTPRDEKDTDTYPKRGEYHIQDVIRYRILATGNEVTSGPTVGKY
jgi:hypothetical protein